MPKPAWLAGTLLLAAACASWPVLARPQVEHVVVIIVDGLRPEAIDKAGAPHIQALAARGSHTTARAVESPETLPSLVSLATGVPPSMHHVTWNDDQGRDPDRPTIFTRAAEEGLRTGLYFGKSKLAILAPRGSADVSFGPDRKGLNQQRGFIDAVAARFAADFMREPHGLAVVHLREPDGAGHAYGWMSEPYLAAVRAADDAVGTVLRAIEGSGRGGATAVLLTADHGGESDGHHAGGTDASWRVPLICYVPGRKPRRIHGAVTLVDVAPTVLALLQLPRLPEAQGKPIKACV